MPTSEVNFPAINGEHKANMVNSLDGRGTEADAGRDRGYFPLPKVGGVGGKTVTSTADGIHAIH